MQVKVTDKKEDLKPFSIEITAEDLDELKLLWHRFNISAYTLFERSGPTNPFEHRESREVFLHLDDELQKYS